MADWHDTFLEDLDPRPWQRPGSTSAAFTPAGLFLGRGEFALEVALVDAPGKPRNDDVNRLWKTRQRGRASPLLLVIGFPDHGQTRAVLCGPAGDQPPIVVATLPQAERLSRAALAEPSRHAAIRFLVGTLPEIDTGLPGVRNTGLLADHELSTGVPTRSDWQRACNDGMRLLGLGGRKLVEGLGFAVEQLGTTASVLASATTKRAVAVFLDEGESFDDPATRFSGTSPVSHALALADRESLPWVVLTRHRQVRLYAARPDTGVGRKGRADTYVELNLALLPDDHAGYLPLLFGSDALVDGGTLDQILETSSRFATDLATRLRERVYFDCVPALAEAVAANLGGADEPSEADLSLAYECTLTILFRVLFVAYAEDKDLLPYRSNNKYADHSLKLIARRLAEDQRKGSADYDASATELWEDVKQLWRAVDQGNSGWAVPPYDGGLFSSDRRTNPAGAALAGVELTDAQLGPTLGALLVDESGTDGVIGPVDFRSLSVREFGTIYEGLLESRLSVAPADLAVDRSGSYVPARRGDEVAVGACAIYFHNRSGARKSTGSYFTKPFAVEHLLDHALEPVLADHTARLQKWLDAGDEAAASAAFFDFRCVDLAMGSGHFLTAAVDRIEARLSAFLALHPIGAVHAELDALRQAAIEKLGELAGGVEIETTSLLRRLVARRCVYGVDLNGLAVELARLSLWIHTFVPGLPLSYLSHNLVAANSLTGVGTIDEALCELDPHHDADQPSLFRNQIEGLLDRASDALKRLATVTEAKVEDVKAAAAAHAEAMAAVEPASRLFDLVVAARLGEAGLPESFDEAQIEREWQRVGAGGIAGQLQALHFPVAFPEVFLRDRPGFDCILGNPPWEEVMVDETTFWSIRSPGIRSLPAGKMRKEIERLRRQRPELTEEYDAEVIAMELLRRALSAGQFPQMNEGNADLYKAFCWRFWHLCRSAGAVGVVLPRAALSGAGTREWRQAILAGGAFDDVSMILNNTQWMFEDVHPQYTIGLVSVRKGEQFAGALRVRGPFRSFAAYQQLSNRPPAEFAVAEFLSWSESASFPLVPDERSVDVFLKLRRHPRLSEGGPGWRARPLQGDFNATTDRGYFDFDPGDTDGWWPVYKGASFNLWDPDTGVYYAWADPDEVTAVLQDKRLRGARRANSVWSAFDADWIEDPDTLPCWYPRLAFRDVTNRTNQRTVIAALVPGSIVITNQAPYLLWPEGDERDEAYLLGVLCSIPLDWYARRVVETHVNFHIFNGFPIPSATGDHPLRHRVEQIAGRLAAVDDGYKYWADAVGVPVGSVGSPDEKAGLIAELDATVGHLYGLAESDLVTIFETFHEGWDHRSRLEAVLTHHRRLA
jgi:hypothetical protein